MIADRKVTRMVSATMGGKDPGGPLMARPGWRLNRAPIRAGRCDSRAAFPMVQRVSCG